MATVNELEARLERIQGENAEALKAERERARKREKAVRKAIARAQAKRDEAWGRRLRKAGATDVTIDWFIAQLEKRAASQAATATQATASPVSADDVQQ